MTADGDNMQTTVGTLSPRSASISPEDRRLREGIGEFVGIAFFGEMLKLAQNSRLKGEFGHGGRGEEVFAGQLHLEFAQRAGRAQNLPLHEALYRALKRPSGQVLPEQADDQRELSRALQRDAGTRAFAETKSQDARRGGVSLTG